MKKLLLVDNYDSFTYNLYQLLKENTRNADVTVLRNNRFTLDDTNAYDGFVISPGPGVPENAGLIIPLIQTAGKTKPVFGVCLGLQAISIAYGGSLINIPSVCHGISTKVHVTTSSSLFKDLPASLQVGRYHSWAVDETTLPSCFSVTARDELNIIMAMEHKEHQVSGVQFHPESILTQHGKEMICNWINNCGFA